MMFAPKFHKNITSLRSQVPDSLKPYFFSTSSSTLWLKALSQNQLQVKVLRQKRITLNRDEYLLLKLRPRTQHLVREVEILGQGVPWMLARSVFPEKTLSGKLKSIKRQLSDKPLGEILFKEPSLRRSPYEFAFHEGMWCRRSIFFIYEKPILLTEIFLPGFNASIL